MKKIISLFVMLNLLAPMHRWFQHPCFAQQQYTFTNYTQEQGLPSGSITGIYKDTTGYIWLTGEEGVTRFDGYNFKVFRHNPDDSTSLSTNNTWVGAFPRFGDIYFESGDRYCKYNPATESFTFKLPFGDSLDLFKIGEVKGVRDHYWVLSKSSVFKISKTRIERFALPNHQLNYHWMDLASPGKNPLLFDWRVIPSRGGGMLISIKSAGKSRLLFLDEKSKMVSDVKILSREGTEDSSTVADIFFTGDNFYLFNKKSIFRFNPAAKSFEWHLDLKHTDNFDYAFPYYLPFNDSLVIIRSITGFINIINVRTGEELQVYVNKKIPESALSDRMILSCTADNNGGVWLGTAQMGIIHYNLSTGELTQYIHEPGNSNSLPGNMITNILPDENGVIWASCVAHGPVKMEPVTVLFKTAVPATAKDSSTEVQGWRGNIRSFVETDDGYWIATLNGLFSYSRESQQFINIQHLCPLSAEIRQGFNSLARDSTGNVWIGSGYGELVIYNTRLKRSFSIRPHPLRVTNESIFRNLFCDSKNRMWISTQFSGVCMVNCNALNFEKINEIKFEYNFPDAKDSSALPPVTAFVVTEDADGNIWAGTENGLCLYNEQTKKWKRYYNIPGNQNSLHNSNVRSLCLDKKGNLWIGTNGGGLNRYNKEQDNFTHFTTANGLINDQIYTLVCDDNGMLWMGTNNGLCRFNPVDYSCRNFSEKDGIQNYEFNTNAAIKLKDGTLLFGGVAGYNIIDPDMIENKKSIPPVVISSFKIFDRETPIGDGHLNLKYDENRLTFEFAALSYYRSQDNRYAYMLEGVDHDWIFSDTRRYVSYPKLEPGDYTFKVKACNSDGTWNESGAQMQITITPPWWKTTWARILFVLVVVGSTIGWFRYRTNALRVRQKVLESEISKATIELREKNQELVTALENLKAAQEQVIQSEKLAAFGTMAKRMAHEIQNPLNFVNNFSEISKQLMDDITTEVATEEEKRAAMNVLNENLEKIFHHGKRASAIINQLQEHHRAGTAHEFFEDDERKD